jgi:hypothetical protein
MNQRKMLLYLITAITFIAGSFIFYACKKENHSNPTTNSLTHLSVDVPMWLEKKESLSQPINAKNIESLKLNLDFTKISLEKLNKDQSIAIIPIRKAFNKEHNINESVLCYLLATLNNSQEITYGEIALYYPEKDHAVNSLPENTFSRIFTSENITLSGKFRFLSVKGGWIYNIDYKNGKLISGGVVKWKDDAHQSISNGKDNSIHCVVYYLETTFFFSDGTTQVTDDYLGTVCTDDGCSSDYEGFCQPGEGGSTGGGGATAPPNDCCAPDPNMQLTVKSISESRGQECGVESVDPTTGLLTKTCVHNWEFSVSTFWFWTWKYISSENYVLQKENGMWKFKDNSVTHNPTIGASGSAPPCINSKCEIISAIPSIDPDRRVGQMNVSYTQSAKCECIAGAQPWHVVSSAASRWPAE